MTKRMCLWLAVVTCCLGIMVYFFIKEGGTEDRGPRYTPAAFKRRWNVNSLNPKAHLGNLYEIEGGYAADYGDGVKVLIVMRKDEVAGVRIRYEAGADQGAGGPRFLLLVSTAINVGTFRWPHERIDQVRRVFGFITPQTKTYRYLYTSFTRAYDQTDGWEFALDFVPNKAEKNSEAPAPPATDQDAY